MEEGNGSGRWKVLLVDDEERARELYGALLREEGHPVVAAASAREAREAVGREKRLGLVILDMRLPDTEGLELFRWIRERVPCIPIIIFTAYGSIEAAVEALKEGAYHYVTKPPEMEEWHSLIRTALYRKSLEEENSLLRQQLRGVDGEGGLVGRSRPMDDVYQWIRTVGPSQATVLVGGESGTGKELAARAVHEQSSRKDGPFVSINCGALPPTLLESELFGSEKGAFTGAVSSRPGHFECADGGTIFLDEIGECSPELQVRLLRVIQEKEFQRVGGTQKKKSDFRLVAATHSDLAEEVKAGRFREDLYYRIHVVSFSMPPLRERQEDIPLLAAHFLEIYSRRESKRLKGISDKAIGLLQEHPWPGNVRELQNVIERGVVVARGDCLEAVDLPPAMRNAGPERTASGDLLTGDLSLPDVERMVVEATLRKHGSNKSQASRVLGISRKLLYSKIREYQL